MWDTLIINPMVNILLLIYGVVGNFGLAIILFTILIRLITHPLSVQQIRSGQKMQEMQRSKAYQELQKKYKDDKAKLQQEQMRMYQEMGINPLGSCLPTLVQFPIIIGLYQAVIRVLGGAPMQMVDLYKHVYQFPPFDKLIPISKIIPIDNQFLWMDLSQPERIYVLGFGIPLLAIVVVVTTWLQSKLMTPASQPGDQGAQMTQMMNLYMPIFMGYLAWTFAAGLSLYFVTSNIVTIVQYAAMGKVDWSNILPGKKPVAVVESKATVSSSSGEKALKAPTKTAPVGKTSKPKPSKGKTAK